VDVSGIVNKISSFFGSANVGNAIFGMELSSYLNAITPSSEFTIISDTMCCPLYSFSATFAITICFPSSRFLIGLSE